MDDINVITIEKNVPIPEVRVSGGGKYRYRFLKSVEVSDSFVINGNTPGFTPKAVRQYLYCQHSQKHGRRYTIRTLSGPNENPTAIRAWRIQ